MTIKNRIKLDKWEVIGKYGISERNYHTKLKKGLKTLSTNQLLCKGRDRYYIDGSIMDDLFQLKRNPNKKNNESIRKYVLSPSTKFDYKGCIQPKTMTDKECVKLIEYVFKMIEDELYPNEITLYYFIEKNKNNKGYDGNLSHIHYLIQTDYKDGFVSYVEDLLKDKGVDIHPFIQRYNSNRWEVEGKQYCVKELTKTSLCGYFNHKKR